MERMICMISENIIDACRNVTTKILTIGNTHLRTCGSILMYHSFGTDGSRFTVDRETFEKQLIALEKSQCRVVPLSELIERLEHGRPIDNLVSITIDDGYKNNRDIALPVIKKYGFHATIFVSTEFIGKSMKNSQGISIDMLDWDDLIFLSNSSHIEIMPHTHSHRSLRELPFTEAVEDIEMSRAILEKTLKKRMDILAFPKGHYSTKLVDYLRNSQDWRGAVTVDEGLVDNSSDQFLLSRNAVASDTSLNLFLLKISRRLRYYTAIKSLFL